jgi:hypothetical protein
MDYEVWSSVSGNRLGAFQSSNEALRWMLQLWSAEGEAVLNGLSLGGIDHAWVLDGGELRRALCFSLWQEPRTFETATSDRTVVEPDALPIAA